VPTRHPPTPVGLNLCLFPLCPLGSICPPLPPGICSTLPFKHTEHSSFCCGLFHAVWSLKRASLPMMSHSLSTHAVMLTVFSLVSMSPRFHHPLCLRARPPTLTSWPDPSSSHFFFCLLPTLLLHVAFGLPTEEGFARLFELPWCAVSLDRSRSTPHHPIFSCVDDVRAQLSPHFIQTQTTL
jgi:hypothetical protein